MTALSALMPVERAAVIATAALCGSDAEELAELITPWPVVDWDAVPRYYFAEMERGWAA